MNVEISPISREEVTRNPAEPLEFELPPDKSILHRILFIGSLTQTAFTIPIPSPEAISHDIVASVLALESLGVPIELFQDRVELQGVGRRGYRMPTHLINCANSGTTARLLMGLLAGQQFNSALTGDDSLSRRPMKRLADLLIAMGAQIVTTPEGTLPLMLLVRNLHGTEITLPVASAQMKSAVLLAGLHAEGETVLTEPWQSRDHTERMLEVFGFKIERDELTVRITPSAAQLPDEITYEVPGDISSAAFLAVAAVILQKQVVLKNVLLNPTRTRFLEIMTVMGVELEMVNISEQWGEERGDMIIQGDRTEELAPFQIFEDDVPLLIDELPVLAILAIFANGDSSIHGAMELRHKESDRLHLVAEQLQHFGVEVEESKDGIVIHGASDRELRAAPIEHGNDHRLAMAFAIAALRATARTTIEGADAVSISYPHFFEHLSRLTGEGHVTIY